MSTSRDRAVLNSIFNPYLPVGESVNGDEDCCQLDDASLSLQVEEEEDAHLNAEDELAMKLEIEGVEAANESPSRLDVAIDCFTRAIEICPQRASGYNNRAQALRLKGEIEGALCDLNNAINLSHGKGKVASQAFCQRGLIRKLMGNEEAARADFESASSLGNTFAKSVIVQMNPYAALCNQMLRDMIAKLHRGNHSEENEVGK